MRPPYILIVDDDAGVRHLLRRFLTLAGHEVREAGTAQDAMAMVEQLPPAVAFCDVHMPGANGLWLADQIRSASPATAMVLATGDPDIPASESLRPGIVAYLLKPLDRRDVWSAVDEGLRWSAWVMGQDLHHPTRRRLTEAAFNS
jgi:DNA-binding NtrC family response regulator